MTTGLIMTDEPNCKGAWALGTACGKCPRCRETALEGAVALQATVRDMRRPKQKVLAEPHAIHRVHLVIERENAAWCVSEEQGLAQSKQIARALVDDGMLTDGQYDPQTGFVLVTTEV